MDCLEDHLNELQSSCKQAVEKYVEDVEQNPELDKIFSDSCKVFWSKHCKVSGCLFVFDGQVINSHLIIALYYYEKAVSTVCTLYHS